MAALGLDGWNTLTGILVNCVLLLGAVVAILKLRLYHVFHRRCRTETVCSHVELAKDRVLFRGNYIVHNIGELPIKLKNVKVRLLGCKQAASQLIEKDEDNELGSRSFDANTYKGLCRIEAGERSIFTLRIELRELPDVVFFVCDLNWPYRQAQSGYIGIYVKTQPGGEEKCEEKGTFYSC